MSKIYDKATAVHGDVYEGLSDSGELTLILSNGGGWAVSGCDEDEMLRSANAVREGWVISASLGKRLYNVFDKESAGSDCGERETGPEHPTLPAIPIKEDNTKESKMELNIVKTTTQTLPSGEVKIDHTVNGHDFKDIKASRVAEIIREASTEIKSLRDEHKDTGVAYFKAEADSLTARRKVIGKLLDARAES